MTCFWARPHPDQRHDEEREQDRTWLRSTTCFRKINGTWLIVHDQVSAPLDFGSGRALLNLAP